MTADYPTGSLRTRSGRKAIVPLWVLEAKVLTPGEFAIYVALISHVDQDGECFPTARRLAEITRQAVGSCRNAVQRFGRLDLLEAVPQYRADGGRTGNLYYVAEVPPPPIAAIVEAYRAEVKAKRGKGQPAAPPTPDSAGDSTSGFTAPTPDDVAENYPREQPKRTKNPRSGTVGAERTVRNARGRSSAATPRAARKSQTSSAPATPAAMSVLARLPKPWRDCEPWVRRLLAVRIDEALLRAGPDSIVSAIERYAPEPVGVVLAGGSDRDAQRHLWAFSHVMRLLAGDLKAGGCPTCGADHNGFDCRRMPRLVLDPTQCLACDGPGATSRAELPMESASFVCDDCWPGILAELTALEAA